MKQFLGGKVTLFGGDSRDVVKEMPDNCVDSIVTDPPYALASIVKRFGKPGSAPAKGNEAFMRASKGFMGKEWDTGEVAFDPAFWVECMRVLKPGGHLLSFGGTRTYHRMACAIEDAGFEIRDTITWNFGSGFPKSHNVSRNLNESRCTCNDPMCGMSDTKDDAICLVQENKKSDMLLSMQRSSSGQGMGETWIQGELGENTRILSESSDARIKESSMEGRGNISETTRKLRVGEVCSLSDGSIKYGQNGRLCDGTSSSDGPVDRETINENGMCASSGPQTAKQRSEQFGTVAEQSESQDGGTWKNCGRCGKPIIPDGLGTALKPAMELICLARKPLSERTVAANVMKWGTGAINIDGCRVELSDGDDSRLGGKGDWGTEKAAKNVYEGGYAGERVTSSPLGRFPANVIHDGSDEVVAAFPNTKSGMFLPHHNATGKSKIGTFDIRDRSGEVHPTYGDQGSAARFFYAAKANKKDRANSKHPTVKPIKLLRYLIRMITPPGGLVMDPFAGSGTTGEAAYMEDCRAILIEREQEYQEDISNRLKGLDNVLDRTEDDTEINQADAAIQ